MSDKLDEKALDAAAIAIAERRDAWKPGERPAPGYRADAHYAITAYLQALRPGSTGVTEGWVLVPKEPTKAMVYAAMARPPLNIPFDPAEVIKADYRAMLAAAGGENGG